MTKRGYRWRSWPVRLAKRVSTWGGGARGYWLLFNWLPIPMVLYCPASFRILAVNAAAVRSYGYGRAELLNMSISALHPPEDRPRLEDRLAHLQLLAVYAAKDRLAFEDSGTWRHRTKDGRILLVDVQSSPVIFKGRSARMIVAKDVTHHREVAEALRASEQRHRQIVTSARDAIISGDTAGTVISWNDAAHRMFGWTEAEMLGQSVERLVPLRHLAAYLGGLDRYAATGVAQNHGRILEVSGRHRDGREFAIELALSTWAENGRGFFTALTRDIEDRRRIERELRASEERLAVCARSAGMAAWDLNLETGEAWTSNALSILGPGEKRPLKSFAEWLEYVHPEDRGLVNQLVARSIDEGIEARADFRVVWPDGGLHWFRGHGHVLGGVGAIGPPRFFGMTWEITELKAAETALRTAKDVAEAASRAKSEFLANMSHEIRTPIAVITGFAELLGEPSIPPAERALFTQTILRNGHQLTRLIDEILDLSKVESGRLTLELLSFPLADALADVASTLQGKARERGIELSIVTEGPLPEQIVSDPTRLRQILLNIVGNAVKFTEKGGVYVTVSHTGRSLRFRVRDTGVGIDAEGATRLFQPFSQADMSTTRIFGGTGLGLLLARKLARELGGDVSLERSAPGEGSTFLVALGTDRGAGTPAVAADAAPDPAGAFTFASGAPTVERKAASFDGRLAGADVLVVEDAPDLRALLSLILQDCGARVDLACDGEEGVAKARAKPYDVVLMDLQLPRLDGFAATRSLRKEGYGGPIVALSAFAMQAERLRSIESGCNAHLNKPIDKERLVSVVSEFAAGRRSGDLRPGPEARRTTGSRPST